MSCLRDFEVVREIRLSRQLQRAVGGLAFVRTCGSIAGRGARRIPDAGKDGSVPSVL